MPARLDPQHPFFQPPILADARVDQPGLARCAPFGGDNHVEGDAIRPIEPLARPAGQPLAKHVDVTRHAHVIPIYVLWRPCCLTFPHSTTRPTVRTPIPWRRQASTNERPVGKE